MRRYAFVLFLLVPALAFAQAPIIRSGNGILNSGGFQQGVPIAPGSLVSIFGSNLASQLSIHDTYPLSTSRAGVTVQFVTTQSVGLAGGTKVFDAAVQDTVPPDPTTRLSQINAQVPWNLLSNGGTATVNVIVTNNGVPSAPSPVTIGSFGPGIFTLGTRAIAANFPDPTFAWPTGAVAGLTSRPAKVGDVVTIYATGLGAVDVPVADGANTLDALRTNTNTPMVLVGNVSAPILFSGLAPSFAGVNIVNIRIPTVPAGDNVPVQIVAGGVSSNTATIAVGP